ncbi:MAG TPA: hypothetical protein DCE41_11000 [Cytophagales bacterium]|nr:hypothetical protein [Cytophagales bacterium]
MRKGAEILRSQVGKKLRGGLFQSFYFDDELVDNINVLFLKFEMWIHITTTDETAILEVQEEKPKQIIGWTDDDGVKFEYPLTDLSEKFNEFNNYVDLELTGFTELVDKEFEGKVCGLKFQFENGLSLTTYSNSEDETFILFNGEILDDLKEKTMPNNSYKP